MPIQICNTCGTSYPDTPEPPSGCQICEDERQFVRSGGQVWTTPVKLAGGQANAWRRLETDLFEIHTQPGFGIGQRALLLRTPQGNVLWDCIAPRSRSRTRIIIHACRIGRAPLTVLSTCMSPTPNG
jgi:hypothetical protein